MNDGGPAYPQSATLIGQIPKDHGGMSLRDWFAGQEQSYPPKAWLLSHYRREDIEESGVLKHEALSKWRYEMADAMIARRKAGTS